MLRSKPVVCSLVGAVGAVLLVGLFLTFNGRGYAQEKGQKQAATVLRAGPPMPNQTPSQPTTKELDDAATPIVDLNDATANPVTSDRAAKNARYDKRGFVKTDLDPRATEFSIAGHWQGGVSDLPTDQSDLVIEGKVTGSAAFLSNDKGAVYSEFTVRVSDTLKVSPGLTVNRGDSIVTERFGGRVRYPDGRIVRYSLAGQGSPMKEKKYLFFLSKGEQGNYKIVTAYELQGNKVFALDGSRVNRHAQGNWAFDKHNDEEYRNFREELEQAIKNPSSANQNRRGFNP